MNKLLTFIFCSLLFSSCTSEKTVQYFSNPVIRGDMPDPSIIRINDTYYATGTSSEWAPFYPMFTSTDLVNWTQTGYVFNKKPEWTSSSFWAPELFYHNNKVYCYYTARRQSDGVSYIGVASADHPTDEFTDHGLLVEFGTEAIDAFVYDDDGQLYISWKAYGLDQRPIEIIGSKLSDDGLSLIGEPFPLLKDEIGIGMEGQYHFKQGDYYYIIYSPNSCCGPKSDYDVYVARSKSFKGPYEIYKDNPILHGDGGEFISSGHGTVVTTPDGRMFYMCHGYLSGEGFYCGRQPILQEMRMTDDNWVEFVTGNVTKIQQPMPFENTVQQPVPDFEDNFNTENIRLGWIWNYVYSDIKAQAGGGKLMLSGYPKEDNNYGTVMCLKPSSPFYAYETRIEDSVSGMRGLTMYGDNKNLMVWALADGELIVKTVFDGEETILKRIPATRNSLSLKVAIDKGCKVSYFWSEDETNWEQVDVPQTDLSKLVRWDRVARPGLIHIGDPEQPAVFSHFRLSNRHSNS